MRGLKKLSLTQTDIKRLLAHREPFLFLSHAKHNVAGERLVAMLTPPPPATPPAPPTRTVLLEALGQAGALVVRQHDAYAHEPLPAFAAMRDVAFRCWPAGVRADAPVEVSAQLVKARRARFGVVHARATIDGQAEPVCQAELVFSFLEGGGRERRKEEAGSSG
jgi:3-hydroxymyristoyl/3-hydroxydecanoyl-(acyl carrier protein) dehydratase